MSLKAKIEAVIYASEEPVTLAQLVGLLGEEGQAELDTLNAQQSLLALEESPALEAGDPDALNAELLSAEPEAEPAPEPAAVPAEPEAAAEPEAVATPEAAPVPEATSEEAEKKLARETAAATKARERALRDHFRSLVDNLVADYANEGRGLEIREVAGGYRLATKPEYHDAVRGFVKSLKPPLKLSLQALETLAVVAYKQPVTAPEISEIRGVDSGGVLGGLMARKLITTAGRKQVIGRPILYKTTKDFLVRFGLRDVSELPSIEEFEKMAGELADADPVQEEIPMGAHEAREGEGDADSSPNAIPPTPASPSGASNGTQDTMDQSVEEMMHDEGNAAPPGRDREPDDPHSVEPMADVHEPQADGNSTPTAEEIEEEEPGKSAEAGA
jgi:segregation and condensation protein B